MLCLGGIGAILYGALLDAGDETAKTYWWGYAIEILAVFAFAFYEVLYEKYAPGKADAEAAAKRATTAASDRRVLASSDASDGIAAALLADVEPGDAFIEGAHPTHDADDAAEREFARKNSGSISLQPGAAPGAAAAAQSTCARVLNFDVLLLRYLGCASCLAGSETRELTPRPAWTKVRRARGASCLLRRRIARAEAPALGRARALLPLTPHYAPRRTLGSRDARPLRLHGPHEHSLYVARPSHPRRTPVRRGR